jgi:hypothetical protein
MKLTNEQMTLLDQILTQGYATKTISILGGKAEITVNSMVAGSQLNVESFMRNIDGAASFVVHTYSIKLVSEVLKRYHPVGHDPVIFKDAKEAEAFLLARPASVVDAIIAAQGAFEKELGLLSKAENLEENFTPTPSPAPEQS